ncbi:MAG: GH3 auxin-responsive promoter family protein [Cyanobacteria bacterium J069]|nr:MAG: GH3 auxin-responsive promoter [Cyanobacteria bacterium J069]
MGSLLLSLVTAVARRTKNQFVKQTRNVAATQERFLLDLLRCYQDTELGKHLGLAKIKSVEQFRQQVPISPYTVYEPYAERVAKGQPNVLTPDPVVYVNMTSGTTGRQKLIPATKRSRQMLSKANQTSIGFMAEAARQRGLTLGKMLMTSSARLFGYTEGGIPYGPISAGTVRLSGWLHKQVFAHPYETLLVADSLARHYVCLLFALRDANLSLLGATFPVTALQLCDYLECYAADLIQDIEKGAIAPWIDLEPNLRSRLERQLKPAPQRAAQLRQVLKTHGTLTPKLAWTNLSLIVTARGGTSNFYLERFPHYFGHTPVFGGIYSSAEATYGVYHDIDRDGTILAIESGFFEFLPEDQWGLENPTTLLPSEVLLGKRYRMVVTNYNGLYRYDNGDVVEVLGFYNQAPIIIFRHRLGGLLSSTTEKTTEFHAIQVMQALQREFDLSLENFCITLSEQEVPPHYLVNVELAPGQAFEEPERFLRRFDEILKEVHLSYAKKRADVVPAPRLRILAKGSFETVRQRLLQRGIPEAQLKFPNITEDRHYLAGLTIEREIRMVEERVGIGG